MRRTGPGESRSLEGLLTKLVSVSDEAYRDLSSYFENSAVNFFGHTTDFNDPKFATWGNPVNTFSEGSESQMIDHFFYHIKDESKHLKSVNTLKFEILEFKTILVNDNQKTTEISSSDHQAIEVELVMITQNKI